MVAELTDIEKDALRGQASAIANKHGCSKVYVHMIIRQEREVNTKLAQNILKDLKILARFLTPAEAKENLKTTKTK